MKQNVDPSAAILPGAVLTGEVTIGEKSSVWYYAVLRGDLAPVIVGNRTNIQEQAVLHVDVNVPVVLGDDVTVGHGAILHGCTVGDGTLIGMGAVVLNGAVIGKNCIIGAGALVTQGKQIPDGSLVVGSPARIVRTLTDKEIQKNHENAAIYVELGARQKD
jgi:carbonic anhydrase/acetyltransferase-like protein (isoleucine patch superfamily)